MPPDQQRLTPDERANLVAYLDKELEEPFATALETKLAHSATARREVEILRKTWALLDHLPRIEASQELSQRTVTQALSFVSQQDVLADSAVSLFRRAMRCLKWAAIMAAAFLLSLVLVRWAWPNPTARLARHLSIAEHLDEYEAVGSFEFLELLERTPGF